MLSLGFKSFLIFSLDLKAFPRFSLEPKALTRLSIDLKNFPSSHRSYKAFNRFFCGSEDLLHILTVA